MVSDHVHITPSCWDARAPLGSALLNSAVFRNFVSNSVRSGSVFAPALPKPKGSELWQTPHGDWVSPGEVPFPWWNGVQGAARGCRGLWAAHRGGSGDKHVPLWPLCFKKNPSYKEGWMGQQELQKPTLA